jgi:hypothetical protein
VCGLFGAAKEIIANTIIRARGEFAGKLLFWLVFGSYAKCKRTSSVYKRNRIKNCAYKKINTVS